MGISQSPKPVGQLRLIFHLRDDYVNGLDPGEQSIRPGGLCGKNWQAESREAGRKQRNWLETRHSIFSDLLSQEGGNGTATLPVQQR